MKSNGQPPHENGVAEEVFARLSAIGDIVDDGVAWSADGGSAGLQHQTRNGSQPPPHKVPRHPEDPPGAYEDAAGEVCDPDAIRVKAVPLGKASQAMGPELFEALVRAFYARAHDVRAGAIKIPAQREAGDKLKFSAGTEAEVARILAAGNADDQKAGRLEGDVVPRVEGELERASDDCKEAQTQVESAQHEVDHRRQQRRQEESERSSGFWSERRFARPRGNLFGRFSFSPVKAALAFAAEIVGTTFVIAPSVADIANVSFEYGVLIAFAVSVALLAASSAAGLALAAVRLPGWLVGLVLLGIYGGILAKFVPGLDALRETEMSGVETLTAATLAACLIAALIGYMLATRSDQRQELADEAEVERAGTSLGDALDNLDRAKKNREEAENQHRRLKQALAELWEQIEQLHDSAARCDVAALERIREGTEAEAEAGTIRAVADTGVGQEEAAGEWASLGAILTHEKARVEEVPEDDTAGVVAVGNSVDGDQTTGLTALQKAALGISGASGIGGLTLGTIPLGIGAVAVPLLILLDQRRRSDRDAAGDDGEPPPDPPSIVPPASDDNEFYIHQPDRTTSKYRDGGAGVSERQ